MMSLSKRLVEKGAVGNTEIGLKGKKALEDVKGVDT